jgi:hypothetical protein
MSFFVKLFAVTAAAVAVMAAVRDERVVVEAGLKGVCVPVAAPGGASGAWYSCSDGRLVGRPDMSRHACTSEGIRGGNEIWRCPAPISADRASSG